MVYSDNQNRAVSMKQVELESWLRATLAMVILALVVFVLQRFVVQTFDIIFEICIFYVPAGALVLLYLYFQKKLEKSSVKPLTQAWLL